MVQLENDVFFGQLFQGGVLGKGGVPALNNAQSCIAVAQSGFHDRQAADLVRVKQSEYGAAIGMSAYHSVIDLKRRDSVFNNRRHSP